MPKSKKKNSSKNRKPMDPIEEEMSSNNSDAKFFLSNDDESSPTSLSTPNLLSNSNSSTTFRYQNNISTSYSFSSIGSGHHTSHNVYSPNRGRDEYTVEDINTNPLNSTKLSKKDELPIVKTWRLDDNSSVTKLLLNSYQFDNIESMFRPSIEKPGELKSELSPPYETKENVKINKLDSEVYFLNGMPKHDVRFINVMKNNINLYDLVYEYGCKDPRINLLTSKQIPTVYNNYDFSCRCFALDNSKENRFALGLNSGDVFISSIPVDKDFNFSTSYHVKMRQSFDSLIALAFDKTISGQSYLCCGHQRGRENDNYISLYDVNSGKDLILDRDVSEKILGMQFLSSDLAVLLLNCMKSIRFVDIRERNGFATIINLSSPLYKVTVEPYNNVQFAGAIGNNLTIFDRRYLSKAIYDFEVGPNSYNISHLEYNPNSFGNITCCSYTSNIMLELDIYPSPNYQHHLIGNKTSESQEAIVIEYAKSFSYTPERIHTSLSRVNNFAWCHQKPKVIIAASPSSTEIKDQDIKTDFSHIKVLTVDNDKRFVFVPPDNSIIYCDNDGLNQIRRKPQIHKAFENAINIDSNSVGVSNKPFLNAESSQEKFKLTEQIKLVKAKPTFELKPEEIDYLFEIEQREIELRNEQIDYDHFEKRLEDVQKHIPFPASKNHNRVPVDRDLQSWFTRSDMNQLSITRAKLGYGFATVPGSAKALIENSYYAIRDRIDETSCLKECWRMLTRIYSSAHNLKLQSRYGTVFPGVRRIAQNLLKNNSQYKIRNDEITFRNKYYISDRRNEILRLVGWAPIDETKSVTIKLTRLINSPDLHSKIRAATMAMFYINGALSKSYLEDISVFLDKPECISRYSSIMINQYKTSVKKMLHVIETNDGITIKNFEKLLEETEDPYLNIMLQFLGRRQFAYNVMQRQIMATNTVRLDDRLAIAAIHIDDASFCCLLKMLTKGLQKSHDPLSILLISGLDDHRYSHSALHSYLKQTNDFQTTALILCAGNCFRLSKIWEKYDMRKSVMDRILMAIGNNKLKNTRKYSLQIVCSYMEWLQSNNLTLQKSYIMTFLRKKLEFPNESKIQAGRTQGLIACNFCGKPILPFIGSDNADEQSPQTLKMGSNRKGMSVAQSLQIAEIERRKIVPKSRGCPHCGRPLPRCLICKRVCIQQHSSSKSVQMDEWFIWCSKCAHGGHLGHLREWFKMNKLCPAGNCKCSCPRIDNILNVDYQAKRKEQLLVEDPFLINGFNVNILSATIDPCSRSRNNSEQDKLRLIRKLCMSEEQPNALEDLCRRGSIDSGITLNTSNPLKSISYLKSIESRTVIGSDSNLTKQHGFKEEVEIAQTYNMIPEIVKQTNAIQKLLQTRGLTNNLTTNLQKNESVNRLLSSSDNLNADEASQTQRKQQIKLTPKKQTKLSRIQQNAEEDANKWLVRNSDGMGYPIATQVKVDFDNKNANSEPAISMSLDKDIRFKEQTILLPPLDPFAKVWNTNPQTLNRLVAAEMFKAAVSEEKTNNEIMDKKMAAQLVKDQLIKEQTRKEARERRKQPNTPKKLRNGTNYFGFDYVSTEIQAISGESAEENTSEAEELAKLCGRVEENIKIEAEEIKQLANVLKEAEESKKMNRRRKKHVRIRDTPDVRVSTPALELNNETSRSLNEVSPRQRKNSTRSGTSHLQITQPSIERHQYKSR